MSCRSATSGSGGRSNGPMACRSCRCRHRSRRSRSPGGPTGPSPAATSGARWTTNRPEPAPTDRELGLQRVLPAGLDLAARPLAGAELAAGFHRVGALVGRSVALRPLAAFELGAGLKVLLEFGFLDRVERFDAFAARD